MQDFQIKTVSQNEGNVSQAISSFNQDLKEKEVSQKASSLGLGYVNLN